MTNKGILGFFFGIFILISGDYIDGLTTYSVNHLQHKALRHLIDHSHAKHFPVLDKNLYDDAEKIRKKITEYISRAIVEERLKEEWKDFKTPIITESLAGTPKRVEFAKSGRIALKEVFHYLQFFPLLYGKEVEPIIFEIPVDGKKVKLKLQNKAGKPGTFDLHNVYPDPSNPTGPELVTDLSDMVTMKATIDELHDTRLNSALKQSLEAAIPDIFENKLDAHPVFEDELTKQSSGAGTSVPDDIKNKAFRDVVEVMASTSILRTKITSLSPADWLRDIDRKFETERESLKVLLVAERLQKEWKGFKASIITESLAGTPKTVKFAKSGGIALKEVFHYLQFFPLLYGKEVEPIMFEIPVDGKTIKLKLQKKAGKPGTFDLHNVYPDPSNPTGPEIVTDLSDMVTMKATIDELHDTRLNSAVKQSLEATIPEIFENKLYAHPVFEDELTKQSSGTAIPDDIKNKAFRDVVEVMASTSILRTKITSLSPSDWLRDIDTKFEAERENLEAILNTNTKSNVKTKLKYEVAASMLQTAEEAIKEWDALRTKGIVVDENPTSVTINPTNEITLRKVFKLLQSLKDIYPINKQILFKLPIGGEERRIYLRKALYGKGQIFVGTKNEDWPDATNTKFGPPYREMVDKVLKKFPESKHSQLAKAILDACEGKLDAQPDFSTLLRVTDPIDGSTKVRDTADTIRATVDFMAVTMVAEAARPTEEVKTKYLKEVIENIERLGRFPEASEMPQLEGGITSDTGKSIKAGRSPAMDDVAIGILQEVHRNSKLFHEAFNDANFPPRQEGGTKRGREYLYDNGDKDVPSYLIREQADGEHDRETIAKKARFSCTGSSTRKKRAACLIEELDDGNMVDEKSIKVTDNEVTLDVVDRRDAKKRTHLEIQVTTDDLATPKRIKESISKSKRTGASRKYAKVNKGLAVHGLIFSALGAIDYFSRGDDVRGGIAVSQSIHTLGGLTGLNEIVSKAGKKLMSYTALKVAKGLKMEEGLARFSGKVEKFMEKGVGKLMGDLPGVGLAFDIYFIEQDVEGLANLNLNDPDDVKLLPLRIVDLVLDVDTTVLNLIGTFCPEAEVITEPLVIVLSIIRMAIDDFYIDIMEEMDKVNWKSPWAGLEFIGALAKGVLEGVADFLSGGLRRQMVSYQAQVDADKKLLSDLKNTNNYYTVVGNKKGEGETIDFTQGRLSSFGGFINFRLFDDGWATLEIGDVTGAHKTIKRKFTVPRDLEEIVLGIGESRDFKFKKETAKLWFVIPIKDYNVICGASLHSKSLYGTYYGNSKNNKFFAVQNPKTTPRPNSDSQPSECNYGNLNLKFVTGNYHYNLYGRGGDDIFYLGPQMSQVTGGEGSDVYVIQSDGGKTVIDNFAEDNKRDMVLINVPFDGITCFKSGMNLDITYSRGHQMRIHNWFTQGDPNYFRHVSFRSLDGVIFVPQATSPSNSQIKATVICSAVAIDKSSEEAFQDINLQTPNFRNIKQVIGSAHGDIIFGNDLNNILEGGKGEDHLTGGRNEDTYIIRANEGCDVINNDADDFEKTTDVVVFDVLYEKINIKMQGNSLSMYDRDNEHTSCLGVESWSLGERYQHMIFTSSDHVVFKVKTVNNIEKKIPLVLDYSSSKKGVNVDLSDSPKPGTLHESGFEHVSTVSDSNYDDRIIGNDQSNYLSCTKGRDYLQGGKGSDNYVIKKTCQRVKINNYDRKEKVDLLLLEDDFLNLRLEKRKENLIIKTKFATPVVVLSKWFSNTNHRHIWLRTRDGVTARIDGIAVALNAVEVSKDPVECQCKKSYCSRTTVKFDLSKNPWTKVTRFQLQSSYCSYKIKGNSLNNYIDPGSGNGYNYQVLEGREGADTYVLKHGYGEFNEIKNFARDKKTDILQLGLELDDIHLYFHGQNDVILASKSKPSSLSVRIMNYLRSPRHQHLQIITSDKVTFEIQQQYPFIKVLSVDLSLSDSPQNISPDENVFLSAAQSIKGSLTQQNTLTGTIATKELIGGSLKDVLHGGPANNIINGREGNDDINGGKGDDIIFGGEGDDSIYGEEGNDYIYGGNGQDLIDGGSGSDTVVFKGDGFEKKGVHIDLSIGFGKGSDAEGDTYKSIENVYGSIHDDFIAGSDSNNNLYGLHGNDKILSHGGNDKLVGGEGNDIYELSNAYGIKVIDNYAGDKAEDTLYLMHLNEEDICPFLVGHDLYLHTAKTSISSVLYHGQQLTIVIQNWAAKSKYRHLKVVLNDAIWTSYALSRVRRKLDQMDTKVRHIAIETNFKLVSFDGSTARLSWKPMAIPVLAMDESTKLFLMKFNTQNPKGMTSIEVKDQGEISISSLDPSLHYVFALYLKKCSATIASSITLTTFGRRRECPAINLENAQVQYKPATSLSHGATTKIECLSGFELENDQSKYMGICLDNEWRPPLPSCHVINHCPELTTPSHGHLTLTGHQEESVAHYVCKKGFKLDGAKERICQKGGQWEDEDPTCIPMSCAMPPIVDNGEFKPCLHMKHTDMHGTFNDPREGFCVKLNCQDNYIQNYKFDRIAHLPRWQSYGKIPRGARVCRDGEWIGYIDATCQPAARLFPKLETWYAQFGTLEIWKLRRWHKTSSFSEGLDKIACSRLSNVYGNLGRSVVSIVGNTDGINGVVVECPKVRFVETITPYEGKLEVLVEKQWQTFCYSDYVTRDPDAETLKICKMIGVDTRMPSLVQHSSGMTDYHLVCPSNVNTIADCKVEPDRQQCNTMLRCRQRCANEYPVSGGSKECTGKFEGDSCKISCPNGSLLRGDVTVECKAGRWVNEEGSDASSHCE